MSKPSANRSTDLRAILKIMNEKSLSYRDVGAVAGVSAGQVWRVLNGESNPTFGTLKGIALGLGITVERLTELLGIEWEASGGGPGGGGVGGGGGGGRGGGTGVGRV